MLRSMTFVVIVVGLLFIGCAGAGDVVESGYVEAINDGYGDAYYPEVELGAYVCDTRNPAWLLLKPIENFVDCTYVYVNWEHGWTPCGLYDVESSQCISGESDYYMSWDTTLKSAATVISNITCGYNLMPDDTVVFYIVFHDHNGWSGLTGNKELSIVGGLSCPGGCSPDWAFHDAYATVGSNHDWWNDIESSQFLFSHMSPSTAQVTIFGSNLTKPEHDVISEHGLTNKISLKQFYEIEEICPQLLYKITYNEKGYGYDFASSTKIFNAETVFYEDTEYLLGNFSFYVMGADAACLCTDGVNFRASAVPGSEMWVYSGLLTDFCGSGEPGFFDLSGYTRSITGNVIPSVKLTAQGNIEYSNNISFYKFEDLNTGSFDLAWNKTGYHNDSISMYVGNPGDYQRDVYLIPLNALDIGEFGGVVYDYCTLKPILGAYVYLFNETADSGKYAYSNKYGFYRFAGLIEDLEYEVSASKDGYDASIVHSFTFNESNVNETHRKTKNIWLLPEGGCPEDGGIPTPPPAPTPTPHAWTNEEIVSWLRVNLMTFFIIVFLFTFLWFIRKAGGSRR